MYLDNLEWKIVPPPETNEENLPFPTHYGILKIGDAELKVYQLNTGERVFDVNDLNDLNALFGYAPP